MIYFYKLRLNKAGSAQMQVFPPEMQLERVDDLFDESKRAALLQSVPVDERYNIFFSVNNVHYGIERDFIEGWFLFFDIDGVKIGTEDQVATLAIKASGLDESSTAVVVSGNGVHLYALLQTPIVDKEYFKQTREHYRTLCGQIDIAITKAGLAGKADTSVWDSARVMRMPGTRNVKAGKADTHCYVLRSTLLPQDIMLSTDKAPRSNDDTDNGVPYHAAIDTAAVLGGCNFLKWCKENQNGVSEPQWYAMLSILGRLERGAELAHEYSREHVAYTQNNTESKLLQAMESAGPRTCKNINNLWGNCKACPHAGRVKTPVAIHGPDFVRTKDIGFREPTKKGPGRPAYDDLLKQFALEYNYLTEEGTERFYVFRETHWVQMTELELKQWAHQKLKPAGTGPEMTEFVAQLAVQRIRPMSSVDRALMNFKNGVVNIADRTMYPHDEKYGFTYVLPYVYDSRATAPTFEKFLSEVFQDEDTVTLIKEYAGYCFSGDDCWAQKALVLNGSGANGKSALLETLAAVVGEDNCSAFPLDSLENINARSRLVNKLFFYSEESSARVLNQSEAFKTLVAGGKMEIKKLYKDVNEERITAKCILSTNEDLVSNDKSWGLIRRLIIVPMERVFSKEDRDPWIKKKLIAEASGILNVCLTAYLKMKERGEFTEPLASIEAREEFIEDNKHSLDAFLRDVVVRTNNQDEHRVSLTDLYSRYKEYCMDTGYKYPVTRNRFTMHLKKKLKGHRVGEFYRVGGKVIRGVFGIRLNEEGNY